MRSSAGIVAGLLFIGLAANCGGSDSNGGATAGSANLAGQGGEGNTNSGGAGGKSAAGTANNAGDTTTMAGQGGGVTTPTGCSIDADCGDTAKCVDTVCKNNDGEACTTSADCQNNCIDKVCTPKKDDGADCTSDDECAHSCITGVCAPVSDVGGDCDVNLGAGGAGAGGAGAGGAGAGGEGAAQNPDCKSPLQCISGKCLTPDGQACTDNVDCINTCVKNVCQPKSTIDGACDDKSDCAVAALICDETSATCKLDLLQQCTDNGQCKSQRCICSNSTCTVRTCKAPGTVCECKWSPTDSTTCTNASADLIATTQDPNGCGAETANYCNQGQCVPNTNGDCVRACASTPDDPNTPNVNEATCTANGGPTGCKAGRHANITAECAFNKAVCGATCTCVLDGT